MLRSRLVSVWTLFALAGSAAALADVDVQVLSGDKVTGSVTPATETETFSVLLPSGASFSCKGKGAKKNGVAVRVVFDPVGEDPAITGTEKGLAATVPVTIVARSGVATIDVTSRDGSGTGAYAFSAKWAVRRKWPFAAAALNAQTNATLTFGADAGAVLKGSVAKSKVAGVLPELVRIDGPDGFTLDLTNTTSFEGVVAPETADYTLVFRNDGETMGRVAGSVSVKPPKTKPRKIDVSSSAIGGGGAGETAVARVVGARGGDVVVPDLGGGGLDDISGASVSIPPGALPFPASIVVGTAPAITVEGAGEGIGPSVFFGPEGLSFGTKSAPIEVTLSIPVNLALIGGDTNELSVYVRDAKGVVTLVPGPYDTTTNPGFVTLATTHFSAYRALRREPFVPPPSSLLTGETLVGAQKFIFASTSGFGGGALGLVTDTLGKRVLIVKGTSPASFSLTPYGGGGTLSADGTDRFQFLFPDPPSAIAGDVNGVLYVGTGTRVYRIGINNLVTRIIGTGQSGDSGDNGPGTAAEIRSCEDILVGPQGNLWICDPNSGRVRFYNGVSGQIVTEFGTGVQAVGTDGTSSTTTTLVGPTAIQFRGAGGFFIGDGPRIRVLDRNVDTNFTLAGDPAGLELGTADAAAGATNARFREITSMHVDPLANKILVADSAASTIRVVDFAADSVGTLVGVPDQFVASPDAAPAPFPLFGVFGVIPGFAPKGILFLEGDGRIRSLQLP